MKSFPSSHQVNLFPVALATQRTEYVVAHNLKQDNPQAVQEVCGFCWKIAQRYRESKQALIVSSLDYLAGQGVIS